MNKTRMFKQMLALQEEINVVVNPDWKAAEYPWHRAVWIECAELVDHYGYKWWKKQTVDWDQIILEIVDIWHFGMSMLLSSAESLDAIATDLTTHYNIVAQGQKKEYNSFIYDIELLAHEATANRFNTVLFFNIMLTAGIDLNTLFKMYIGKNVLNKFRQANGYKHGTYRKIWFDGLEDNEHLTKVMNSEAIKDCDDDMLIPHILSNLQQRYDHITENHMDEEIAEIGC